MNIVDVVQNIIVSRRNPSIDDLLDHHTNAVDPFIQKYKEDEELPF
jgi:hypothetical protein